MGYLPVCLDLTEKICVVCGGGMVAERKVQLLLDAAARVVVISPRLSPRLQDWRNGKRVEHVAREYRPGDLDGAWLAIAATDDRTANLAIAREGDERGVLVNVVDDPTCSNFNLPALLRRGSLAVAVSTDGRSPATARWLRDQLQALVTEEHATLLDLAADARQTLRSHGETVSADAWQRALGADLLDLICRGEVAVARARLLARLGIADDGGRGTPPRVSQ